MTACLVCSTPNLEEFDFCTSCGWPRRQPSPYGGEAKALPVVPFAEAPGRDPLGRPLAYDPDPRSGRAYVPGAIPNLVDKIPDYPASDGPGNRRSGEVFAGAGKAVGADQEGGVPVGAAFGAGRMIWADAEHLFIWDVTSSQVVRSNLANLTLLPGRDTVLALGWRTYLRAERGLAVHDGMSGDLTTLAAERFSAMTGYEGRLVAASGEDVWLFRDGSEPIKSRAPFGVAALAGTGPSLAAFGEKGEAAVWSGGSWSQVASAEPGAIWAQGWIVNGHVGVRTTNAGFSSVRYIHASTREPVTAPFPVATDGPVSVIPGRVGFEQHRLLGFVGGSEPHISIYHPHEATAMKERRPISMSALGATVATVRRQSQESSIVVATVDTTEKKVEFNFLRDDRKPLPSPLFQPPNTSQSWLVPHAEGLIVLSFDGKRSIVNNVPYPA